MNESTSLKYRRATPAKVWLEFLGSMNLAITLLVAIAIASVVGTVLQQNQPYQDYIIKFGPFWFDVFNRLGLFNVYAAGWFVLILAVLVVSTSVCLYRNTPQMLRELRNYRLNVKRRSLQAFHLKREWSVDADADSLQQLLGGWLSANGYRFRVRQQPGRRLLAAMKGRLSRFGYFFTHSAIVVICLGALFDGNLPLKLRELSGQLRPETRELPAAEVPDISRLPVDNPSFRGSVSIPEGSSANVVFLQLRDGYLLQPLPFSLQVRDFRIEHYASGQPKSFESDLVLLDPQRDKPLEQTISVNHPLVYRGYSIYQASFADGGTGLTLSAWPLSSATAEPFTIEGRVLESRSVETPSGSRRLEFSDFRMFNINPVLDEEGKQQQKNFGPSFTFRLRDSQGQAREFENYMSPLEFDGRLYFLSGVRESPAEPFRYLHIPVDPKNSLERFMAFRARLFDRQRLRETAKRVTGRSLGGLQPDKAELREQVEASMLSLVSRFREGGFDAVVTMVAETVADEKREEVMQAYFKVLQNILGEIYVELLGEEGVDVSQGLNATDALFFDDALTATGALGAYQAPFFLQLTSYNFVQASGLQITRSPGKNVVYTGFALLILGVFLMFYVPNRRLWFLMEQHEGVTRVLAAASGNRHQRDLEQQFERLCEQLDDRFRRVGTGAGS